MRPHPTYPSPPKKKEKKKGKLWGMKYCIMQTSNDAPKICFIALFFFSIYTRHCKTSYENWNYGYHALRTTYTKQDLKSRCRERLWFKHCLYKDVERSKLTIKTDLNLSCFYWKYWFFLNEFCGILYKSDLAGTYS